MVKGFGLPDVVVANIHRKFTGVTATIRAVLPQQRRAVDVGLYGTPLGVGERRVSLADMVMRGWRRPVAKPFRIWHARRNTDLVRGILFRDVLRMPLKIVFTSAAIRRHSAVPRWLIARADAVIATTPLAASFVPKVMAVVPHGIDVDSFTPPPDKADAWRRLADERAWPGEFGIGIAGRIRPEKGTDVFVEALIRVLPDFPGVTGVVIGAAHHKHLPFREKLMARLEDAGLAQRVVWPGEVSATEMVSIYQALGLYVAAARYEGFGLTPAEAMACGTPILCTRTGAFADMAIEGRTGRLVPPGDVDALATALRRCLADRAALAAMTRECRRHAVETFAVAGEARAINGVYRRLWGLPEVEVAPKVATGDLDTVAPR